MEHIQTDILIYNIDSELSFDFHVSRFMPQAGGQLNVLLRLQKLLDQDAKLAIVQISNTVLLFGISVLRKILKKLK